MKTTTKICLFSLIIISNSLAFGQNYITVGQGENWSQYTSLDSAIVHAQNGDFVYIPGGNYTLNTSISKRLYIYGAGHYPDSTLATNETNINNSIMIGEGADDGILCGIHITNYIRFGSTSANQEVHNYAISRCKIDGDLRLSFDGTTSTLSDNLYFSENVIVGNVLGGNSSNAYFEKNIIQGYIKNFTNGGCFRNNIFLFYDNASGGYSDDYTVFGHDSPTTINSCLFENCVILDSAPLMWNPENSHINTYIINCILNNNIFIENITFPYQTNIGSNNTVNQPQNTIFINQIGTSFNYSHDYHLKSTSPGKNAGTDGTDIGIYGTGQSYKDGAVPANPHIQSKAITIENNLIRVNVKVAAQGR